MIQAGTAYQWNGALGIPQQATQDGFWAIITGRGEYKEEANNYHTEIDQTSTYTWIGLFYVEKEGRYVKCDGVECDYNNQSSQKVDELIILGATEVNKRKDIAVGTIVFMRTGGQSDNTGDSWPEFVFEYSPYSPRYGEIVDYAPSKTRFFDNRYWVKVVRNTSLAKTENALLKPDHDAPDYEYVCAENINEPKRPVIGTWQYTHMVPSGQIVLLFPVIGQTYVPDGDTDHDPVRYTFTWNHPVRYARIDSVTDCGNVIGNECDQAAHEFGTDQVYLDFSSVQSGTPISKNGIVAEYTNQVVRWLPTSTANVGGKVRQYGVVVNPVWKLDVGTANVTNNVDAVVNDDTTRISFDELAFTVTNETPAVACEGRVRIASRGISITDCKGNVAISRNWNIDGTLYANNVTNTLGLRNDLVSSVDFSWNNTVSCEPKLATNGATCCQDLVSDITVGAYGNQVTLVRFRDCWTNGLLKSGCGVYNNATMSVPWIIGTGYDDIVRFTTPQGALDVSIANGLINSTSTVTTEQISNASVNLANDTIDFIGNSTTSDRTVTIPTSTGSKRKIYIKNAGSKILTIGGTVDGVTNPTINPASSVTIYDSAIGWVQQ